jgi:hypothetical protein
MIQENELGNVESWACDFECLDNAISYANYEKYGPEYESEVEINERQTKFQKEKELDEMKRTLADQFPSIDFNCLQKQTDKISTKDASIHYRHKAIGQIYSWNQIAREWRLSHNQKGLQTLLFE